MQLPENPPAEGFWSTIDGLADAVDALKQYAEAQAGVDNGRRSSSSYRSDGRPARLTSNWPEREDHLLESVAAAIPSSGRTSRSPSSATSPSWRAGAQGGGPR